jgi:hypothetical protein
MHRESRETYQPVDVRKPRALDGRDLRRLFEAAALDTNVSMLC